MQNILIFDVFHLTWNFCFGPNVSLVENKVESNSSLMPTGRTWPKLGRPRWEQYDAISYRSTRSIDLNDLFFGSIVSVPTPARFWQYLLEFQPQISPNDVQKTATLISLHRMTWSGWSRKERTSRFGIAENMRYLCRSGYPDWCLGSLWTDQKTSIDRQTSLTSIQSVVHQTALPHRSPITRFWLLPIIRASWDAPKLALWKSLLPLPQSCLSNHRRAVVPDLSVGSKRWSSSSGVPSGFSCVSWAFSSHFQCIFRAR